MSRSYVRNGAKARFGKFHADACRWDASAHRWGPLPHNRNSQTENNSDSVSDRANCSMEDRWCLAGDYDSGKSPSVSCNSFGEALSIGGKRECAADEGATGGVEEMESTP